MYCANCGKAVIQGSRFCPHCGEAVVDPTAASGVRPRESSKPVEWEYFTFEKLAPKGKYLDVVVGAELESEAAARLAFWYRHEADLREGLQQFLEDGWEPINEIGPSCLMVTTSAEYSKGCLQTLFSISAVGFNWWLIGIRVKFRRIKGTGTNPPPVIESTIQFEGESKVDEKAKARAKLQSQRIQWYIIPFIPYINLLAIWFAPMPKKYKWWLVGLVALSFVVAPLSMAAIQAIPSPSIVTTLQIVFSCVLIVAFIGAIGVYYRGVSTEMKRKLDALEEA